MSACTDTPISWLRLERLALGESEPEEVRAIETHLAICESCRTRHAQIAADTRPMPALSLPARHKRAHDTHTSEPDRKPTVRLKPAPASPPARIAWVRISGAAAALAAAAALLFFFTKPRVIPSAERSKGDSVSLSLVRSQGPNEAGVFVEGEPMKALLTCVGAESRTWDLMVFDADGVSFPLSAPLPVGCGNQVPIPGAFRLDGPGPHTVCIMQQDSGLLRSGIRTVSDLGVRPHSCIEINAVPQ